METLKANSVYVLKFDRKIQLYNHSFQLPDYFAPMIGNKKEIVVAELGAALINTIGDSWPGVKVTVVASDVAKDEYDKLWKEHGIIPHTPIEYQDFENLTYPDETFDIVHCRNSLDHTPNLMKAVEEMKRVCKVGGWVYLAHAPGQKTRYGGHHYHDFETVVLPGFSNDIDGELIINKWHKTT